MNNVTRFLDKYLKIEDYINDVSNNGIQIDNKDKTNTPVKKICFGVDISIDLVDKAIKEKCDMIIVHHGLSWRDSLKHITGRNYEIISRLIRNNILLYGVHAPLDAHPDIGHNAVMAKLLGLEKKTIKPFGTKENITWGCSGELKKSIPKEKILPFIRDKLKFKADKTIKDLPAGHICREMKKIGVISGGGAFGIAEAYEKGFDTLITGERSHGRYLAAKDLNINLIFAGHYHTETMGIKALEKLINKKFPKIKTIFVELDTDL